MEKFTIEEIRNYLAKADSLGDAAYFLSAERIRKANEPEEDEDESNDETDEDEN